MSFYVFHDIPKYHIPEKWLAFSFSVRATQVGPERFYFHPGHRGTDLCLSWKGGGYVSLGTSHVMKMSGKSIAGKEGTSLSECFGIL